MAVASSPHVYAQHKRTASCSPQLFEALEYLRNQITTMIDYEDEAEVKVFRQLCASLCLLDSTTDVTGEKDRAFFNVIKSDDALYTERTLLFERLIEYIPEHMKQPSGNLTNAVRLS